MTDSYAIIAATDPMLWPGSASSCGFMAPYNPKYGAVSVAYMLDFRMLTRPSYAKPGATEFTILGDASMPAEELLFGSTRVGVMPRGALSGSSGADLHLPPAACTFVQHVGLTRRVRTRCSAWNFHYSLILPTKT